MEKWSDIQPPEMLEFSRKHMLIEESLPLFLSYLGIKEGDRVADIGSGTGCFTRYLANGMRGKAKFYGVEPDETYLNFAREITKKERLDKDIEYRCGIAYELPFEDESIDIITDFTTLINLEDPDKYIKECLRVLKRGGRLTTSSFLSDYQAPERLNKVDGEEILAQIQKLIQEILKNEVFSKVTNGMNDLNVYSLVRKFEQNGVGNIQIHGIFPLFSPDDHRYKTFRDEWLRMNYMGLKQQILNISMRPELYEKHKLNHADIQNAMNILEQRYEYERTNCTWIFSSNLELVISGIK
jgi:Methylase involved in ubiquinone/menaquinone biosynthesis